MVASRPTSGGLVGKALGMHDGLARETNLGLEPGTAHTGDVLGALLAAKAAPTETGVATRPAPLAGEVIPADVLWACTTCGACVDQCPVDIEHLDHVVDVRRQQVLMESAFPKELGGMFHKIESKGNPWGLQELINREHATQFLEAVAQLERILNRSTISASADRK